MTESREQPARRARGLDVMGTLTGGGDNQAVVMKLAEEIGPLGDYVLDHVLGSVWSRPGLSRRDRSLIVVAMIASIGGQSQQLLMHVGGALNHGVTPDEVREIAIQLCGYAGFPRAIEAMQVVNEAIETKYGDAAPRFTPAQPKDEATRRADGIEIFQRLTGTTGDMSADEAAQSLEDSIGPALAPAAIDWGFGELWAREQLSQRDRSLMIVAALAAMGRTEQLDFHIPGAFNNGVTADELEEVILMVSLYAGFPYAATAIRILRAHMAAQ